MIRKTQRGLSSTGFSSSDALEPSKLPNEILRLGARIVRELDLEPGVDTLGRWMAHHIAEMMQEVESAEGSDKEQAQERAVDLILKLWARRRNLPGGAYPLNDLEPITSVIGRLRPEASPYQQHSTDETEKLLARIFDGLRLVVAHGVLLISETSKLPDDLDAVGPFLDEEERQLIEAVGGWIAYVKTGVPQPPLVVLTEEEKADMDAELAEIAELEKLDPKARSNRILSREIDGLIEALSDLKRKIAAEATEVDREG